ncbi:hypothetical protein ACIQAC_39225 [Streptomyces sp. NPDC088387]|uniref:hypothetical protein n=1 Tax=Streptomyces sp. NPDC088387 TaxID=3365859 RepID=UPI0037F111F5
MVLAQWQGAPKSNEIPAFALLLGGLELENAVVIADALHTQHGRGAYLTSRGAHYVALVKKNHPGLYAKVRKLPGGTSHSGTALASTLSTGDEIRRLKVAAFSQLDYTAARQTTQVVRWRRDVSTGKADH